jgi:hypothetical protein
VLLLHVDAAGAVADRPFGEWFEGVERGVAAAFRAAASAPPSPEALDRARSLARLEWMLATNDFDDWSALVGYTEVVAGDVRLGLLPADAVQGIWAGDVQAAANRLLRARRVVVRRRGGAADPPGQDGQAVRPATSLEELTPTTRPARLKEAVAGNVTAVIRTALTRRLMQVETRVASDRRDVPERLAALVNGEALALPPRNVPAYVTYHGLDLQVSGPALVSRVAPGDLTRVLALHSNLVRAAATTDWPESVTACRHVIVEIETPFGLDEALEAVRSVWGVGRDSSD